MRLKRPTYRDSSLDLCKMTEETEKIFVSWKKTAGGTNNMDINVIYAMTHGLRNANAYNRLRFKVKLKKQNDFPAFKLGFVASMESQTGMYPGRQGNYIRPSLDHCSVQILLVGPSGIEIVKRFHVQMRGSDLPLSHDELCKDVVLSEYQDPYFFKKSELESSGIVTGTELNAFTATVEIFGRLKMMANVWVQNVVVSNLTPRLLISQFWDHSSSIHQSKKINFNLDSSPTDVIFTFSGALETVEAHSYVLAEQSEVFRKMLFEVDMKEKGEKSFR